MFFIAFDFATVGGLRKPNLVDSKLHQRIG
jgi:hypothetical protein